MRKRVAAAALALLLMLALCACTAQSAVSNMTLQTGELTEEEKNVLSLLGDSGAAIFDYAVDESIRSVRVERYQLDSASGAWTPFGGASFIADGEKGRIALTLDPRSDEIRLAVQDAHGTSAVRHEYPHAAAANLAVTTSFLSEPTDIVPGQEIPLAVQILTEKNEIVSYNADYFFYPEEYAKFGYEYVYAITVTFMEDPLA